MAKAPSRGRRRRDPDRGYDVTRARPLGPLVRMILGAAAYVAVTLFVFNSQTTLQAAKETSAAKLLGVQIAFIATALISPFVVAIASVATALIGFRFRLALDLLVAGLVTSGVVYLLNLWSWEADFGPPLLVALAIVAYPYFQRRGRRLISTYTVIILLCWLAILGPPVLVAVGQVSIGYFCGNLVALVMGVRQLTINERGLRDALDRIGVKVRSVEALDVPATRTRPYLALTPDGSEVFVKVHGAVERDLDWVTKMRRRLLIRGAEDDPVFTTSRLRVAHEGFVTDLARMSGVRTPEVAGATVVVTGEAVFMHDYVHGETLDNLADTDVTDELMSDMWRQTAALHAAGLAHRELRIDNFLVDGAGRAWLLDMGTAEFGVPTQKQAFDVAELLTSTAIRVGPARAVAACEPFVARDIRHEALRVLVPRGLTGTTRRHLKEKGDLIDTLREVLAASVDADPNERTRLSRVEIRTLVQVIGLGLVMYLLLPQLTNFWNTVGQWERASALYLTAAFVFSLGTYPMNALQLMGSVPGHLPFGWTCLVPIAAEFANRVTPGGVGGMAVTGAYLRKAGHSPTESALGVTLTFLFAFLVNIPTLLIMVFLARDADAAANIAPPDVSPTAFVLLALFAVVAAAVTLSIRRVRVAILERIREAGTALRQIATRPRGAVMLLGGSVGQMTAYVLCFLACLYAFGSHLSVFTATAIYLGGSALGQLVPTPGAVGGVEALLIAGLTRVGVDSGTAVAAVLTFRLFTYWLPTVPSIPVYRMLERAGRI
ncbi:MAG: flippase-like domain-containing protein [Acidimicrobiia bacterium]|nr:flippase-like domain-containing protein [Acidimicrobiia bacterium]